jgi:hypothetical protein
MVWNGIVCIPTGNECASFAARAAMLASEVRAIKAQAQAACSGNSPAADCYSLKQQYAGASARYRMLLNEAPVACRASWLDPSSL